MLHPILSVLVLALAWLLGAPHPATAQQVLVKPYVQPGDGDSFGKADVKILCWLTDQPPGDGLTLREYQTADTWKPGSWTPWTWTTSISSPTK